MKRGLTLVSLLFVACALFGCKKVTDVPRVDDKTPLPPPANLLFEASLPRLEGGVAGLVQYVNKIKPGMGMMVGGQASKMIAGAGGVSSLDGAKGDAPVRLLVIAGKTADDDSQAALLVDVADEKKLREAAKKVTLRVQDGHAVLGEAAAVEAVAPYAFATLARKAPPTVPAATVYPAAVLAAYGKQIADSKKQFIDSIPAAGNSQMTRVIELEYEGFVKLLELSDAIELRVEASADDASLDIGFVPKAGSVFATFVSEQKPATSGLLERLPATPALMVAAGQLHLGALREQLLPFAQEMMAQFLGASAGVDLQKVTEALLDVANGQFAMAATWVPGGGLQFRQLMGVSDPAKADTILGQVFDMFVGKAPRTTEIMGIKSTTRPLADVPAHDGVKLRGYVTEIDLAGAPPEALAMQERMYPRGMRATWGVFDDVMGMAAGAGDPAAIAAIIDAARGKAPRLEPPATAARLLDDSRARGESLAITIDIAGFIRAVSSGEVTPSQGAMIVALGFQGGRAHFRVAVPSAHVLELLALQE